MTLFATHFVEPAGSPIPERYAGASARADFEEALRCPVLDEDLYAQEQAASLRAAAVRALCQVEAV